jgi:flagellar motor switch protein FliG
MPPGIAPLSGTRKAAILLVTLGAEASAPILRQLTEAEIEDLTVEISKMRDLPQDTVHAVLDEFVELAHSHSYIMQGGFAYAREVLHKALGPGRADEVLGKVQVHFDRQPFLSIHHADPKQLADFIRREQPQTIALILANMEPEGAAHVLAQFPPDTRVDVVQRLATMETTSPEVIKQVDQVLERRFESVPAKDASAAGGTKAVAKILNRIDRSAEKFILEALEPANPELAEEIRRLLFVFDDLARLDGRAMQRLLKDVEQKDLALAMKAAADAVVDKIHANLSEHGRNLLRQEIEHLGPVRLRDVEDAQARILRVVRALEEAGEVVIASHRGAGDLRV